MISFDKTEFILGNIKYGDTKVVTVNVTNTSNKEIELQTSNSSCSCTTGSLKSAKIQPTQITQFLISLNSVKAGRGTNQVKTIQLKYITDGVSFTQVFKLKANII